MKDRFDRDTGALAAHVEINAALADHDAGRALAWWRNHDSFAPAVVTAAEQFLSEHLGYNETVTLATNAFGVRFDV